MTSITPLPGWNISLDNFDQSGEFTVELKSSGVKIHCNNHKSGYKLTALHSIDGVLDERKVTDKSNVQSELDDLAESVEGEYV